MINMMSKIYIKVLYIICALLFNMSVVFAQAPYITNIDKTSAAAGETLLIFGSNFPVLASTAVRFGGANATVVSATSGLIEVTVPSGATTDNISVINTTTGEVAFSNEVFFLSFGGANFNKDNFASPVVIASGGIETYDLCACDFDADGKIDIVSTNEGSNSINIYTNNSTFNAITLAKTDIDLGIVTVNIVCGDFNGDSKADLVVSRGNGGNQMFVLTNTSTAGNITFGTPLVITSPNDKIGNVRDIRRVIINDIDLDGKPDIVTSILSENVIDIYKNNGTPLGAISFDKDNPSQFTITDAAGTSGLDVKDLNNDGLPDIVYTEDKAANFFVLQNQSEPGTIAFLDASTISVAGFFQNIKLADLDNDGKIDVALANLTNSSVKVLKNATSAVGGTIAFDSEKEITNVQDAWALDFGDFEGDGDLDIVVTSGNPTSTQLSLLVNNGSLNFTNSPITLGKRAHNVKVFDVNGDAKPDLAFTQLDESTISIILNKHCITPKITPAASQKVCPGTAIRLQASESNGATYEWQLNGVAIAGATNNFFDIAGVGGDYRVLIKDGICSEPSNVVNITIDNGLIGAVTAGNDIAGGSICEGETINLSTTITTAGATFSWTGPNGFVSELQNPPLTDAKANMSGKYTVVVSANGCIAAPATTTISVVALPVIIITNDGQDTFCTGNSVTLKVTNFGTNYTYGWLNGTADQNIATTTFTASDAGMYKATIKHKTSGCIAESPVRELKTISLITADFTIDDPDNAICKDLPIAFTATSMGEDPVATYPLSHSWAFGDTNTSTVSPATNTYTAAGTQTAVLTTSYTDITNCPSATKQLDITVTDIPVVTISPDGGSTEKCPSATLNLSIDSQYLNPVWSTADEESNINVLDPDTYTVTATDAFGCSFTSSIIISNLLAAGISISSSTNDIDPITKTITLAEDQEFVELTVFNATANIAWTPSHLINDVALETIKVFLQETNIVAQVTADDPEGCRETDMVTIKNPNIRFKKAFSPNGDGIGDDCWEISNSFSQAFEGCKIFIFDSKGSLIKEAKGPFIDDCVWDGNLSGSPVPEGVYYYALKCDGEGLSKSGAILLAR